MEISFSLNNKNITVNLEDDLPLLWVLRENQDLKGTKFGCGMGLCGACTVLVDGEAIRSCSYPVSLVADKNVVTIEGLGENGLHPVQQAWVDEIVPQCGYCQPGFMMATAALLAKKPNPTDEDIDQNITNICRCGTYTRMRKAIHKAASLS